jgi:hypothetical protein
MNTVPDELTYGFLGNIADHTRNLVFGQFYPEPPKQRLNSESLPETNHQRDDYHQKKLALVKTLKDIKAVYSAARPTYEPFCLGIIDGVSYLLNALSKLSLDEGIQLAKNTLEQRLSAVNYIKVAFLSHNVLAPGTRLHNQDKLEVSSEEAYVYGCREGLSFVLKLAKAVNQIEDENQVQRSLGKRLSQLNKSSVQPSFDQIDLVWQGWLRSDRFIRYCSQQIDSESLDPTRYEELLVEKEQAIFFIEELRANLVMFYTFKLGFGFIQLTPKQSNKVLDTTVAASSVPKSDIIELLNLHAQAGSRPSAITWLR